MKKLAPFLLCLFIGTTVFSQVGINTTEPTSTLDVAGTLRVRGGSGNGGDGDDRLLAVRIIGVDDQGNYIEVEIDENVILKNNKLSAIDRTVGIGDTGFFNVPILNNVNLIILPGEPNHDTKVMRIRNLLGNSILTGLKPGVDGQQVWLYPVDGDLTIWPNSILSLFGSRIEGSGPITIKRYEMLELMYDATRGKWIPMGNGM